MATSTSSLLKTVTNNTYHNHNAVRFDFVLFCSDCIGLSWFNAVSFQIFGIVWELWNPVTDFHEKLCLFIRNCFAVKEIFKNSFFLFLFLFSVLCLAALKL